MKNATCESIVAALERARDADEHVAVLHILCHGHGEEGTFGLALGHDEDHGGVDVVSASRLQMLLKDYAGLVRLVVIAACDGSNAGEVGAHLGSVAQEVHKAGFGAVIASRFPLSWKGAYVFATELYESILARGDSLEEAFLSARSRLKPLPAYDWASMQLYARAADGDETRVFNWRPYRGLSAFAPEHARFFFGRDREIEELTRDLDALVARDLPRLLVVSGASGTGKSSMVLGGAIPRWRAASTDASFAHLVVRPGAAPSEALAQVRARADIVGAMCRRFVVVVDQFEEVFTHRDSAGALALARGLWELASEPGSPLCVIVTMRVDFLARCNELVLDDAGLRFDKIACDPTHQVLVAQMSPDQLVEAIEGPARAAGIAIEPGVAREIVRDVEAAPGALPLMSHALYLLWSRREGPVITRAAYKALGSVHGALDEHAESQLAALRDDDERAVARRLMVSLVHPGAGGEPDTRRRRAVDELAAMFARDRERFERVRERLVDARLLVTGGEARAQTVEVAHEALIRSWKTFKSWIDADRTRLARLAQLEAWAAEWKVRPDAVLHGSRLGYAEEVEKEGVDDLPQDVRALLDASREARRRALDAEARSRRVRRALIAAAFATVSAFSGVGFTLWRRAEAARRDADEKRAAAIRSERAAIESEALSRASELRARAESTGQELENLAAAIELRDDIVRRLGATPRSVDAALFQTAAIAARRPLLQTDLDSSTFALSPDGTRLAATRGGSAYLWSTRDGHLVAACVSREQGNVERVRPTFTPDGARMIVGFRNATACSVSARDGTGAITLGVSDPISAGDQTSQTGHTLLIASDGSLALTDDVARDTRTGAAVLTLPHGSPGVVDLRSDGDGRVVTVSVDAVIRRWSRGLTAPAEVEVRTHGHA
ncbi:MAG: CHAT domain-containing protein [Polyangiales bacterium]